ncbi:MAG: hypothetical protein ABI127_01960 [Dokdonella sp.]
MNIALNTTKNGLLSFLVARINKHSHRFPSALLALLAATSMGVIHAQNSIDLRATSRSAAEVPWLPDVIAAAEPYLFDPSFNDGRFVLDHFQGPAAADEVGVFTARMSNGDAVVAGLVPSFGTVNACNYGQYLCRLGLVRYNAQGVRVPWSNPGIYGFHGDEYIIYPATNVFATYHFIRDLKIASNDRISVMVDTGLGSGGSNDVAILSFNSDGSPIQIKNVFGEGGSADTSDFYGAQIALISSGYMVVTATGYDPQGGAYVAANRLLIQADGTLFQDQSWGSEYAGAVNRLIKYRAPGGYCGQSSCEVTANYATAPVGMAEGNIYIGGNVHIAGNNWDPIVLKINSTSGVLKAEFNGTGWSRVIFDEPNSSLTDFIAGLYVYQNDVYLAAQVDRNCFQGVGMAKINGATGQYVAAFGSGGKIVFGGEGNDLFCNTSGDQKTVPYAISATGGRIGVVGYQGFKMIFGNSYEVDPMMAVVNAVNGSVLSFHRYPVTRTDGSRAGDAVLAGIYGGPLATSPFTVSGYGRDTSVGNTLSYVSGRFIPVSADRIFASGFGSGSDL